MNELLDRIQEATIKDLQNKHRSVGNAYPKFWGRVDAVRAMGGIRLESQEPDVWKFKVHSGTKADVWYDVVLRWNDIPQQLARLVPDKRVWKADGSGVDLRKLAPSVMFGTNIQLVCSDPSDLYHAWQFIRSKDKYNAKYTEPELRSPKRNNRRQLGSWCKHIQAIIDQLPMYEQTFAKYLAQFYPREIQAAEQNARKQFNQMQAATAALAKKEVAREQPKRAVGTRDKDGIVKPVDVEQSEPPKPKNK